MKKLQKFREGQPVTLQSNLRMLNGTHWRVTVASYDAYHGWRYDLYSELPDGTMVKLCYIPEADLRHVHRACGRTYYQLMAECR